MRFNRFNLLLSTTVAITALSGCTGTQKKTTLQKKESVIMGIDTANTTRRGNYYGTYEGSLPCADCGGVRTTLIINSDTTYELRSEYLKKKKGCTVEVRGIYNVVNENLIELVTPSSGEKTFYKILDGAIALSDSLGTINSGEFAEQYVLKKQ